MQKQRTSEKATSTTSRLLGIAMCSAPAFDFLLRDGNAIMSSGAVQIKDIAKLGLSILFNANLASIIGLGGRDMEKFSMGSFEAMLYIGGTTAQRIVAQPLRIINKEAYAEEMKEARSGFRHGFEQAEEALKAVKRMCT